MIRFTHRNVATKTITLLTPMHHAMNTYGEWRNSAMHSKSRHWKETSDELHVPTVLLPEKMCLYPLVKRLGEPQSRVAKRRIPTSAWNRPLIQSVTSDPATPIHIYICEMYWGSNRTSKRTAQTDEMTKQNRRRSPFKWALCDLLFWMER
jgi:hypothetical protein